MKKQIGIDRRADKEIKKFPALVQAKVDAALKILARDGKLEKPFSKKLDEKLFEIRIKHQGQWRVLYTYFLEEAIIILSAFHKKTQKTPFEELQRAQKR